MHKQIWVRWQCEYSRVKVPALAICVTPSLPTVELASSSCRLASSSCRLLLEAQQCFSASPPVWTCFPTWTKHMRVDCKSEKPKSTRDAWNRHSGNVKFTTHTFTYREAALYTCMWRQAIYQHPPVLDCRGYTSRGCFTCTEIPWKVSLLGATWHPWQAFEAWPFSLNTPKPIHNGQPLSDRLIVPET